MLGSSNFSLVHNDVKVLPVPQAISSLARSFNLSASITASIASVWCGRGLRTTTLTGEDCKRESKSFSEVGQSTGEASRCDLSMRCTSWFNAACRALGVYPLDEVIYILPCGSILPGSLAATKSCILLLDITSSVYALHCTAHRLPDASTPTRSIPTSGSLVCSDHKVTLVKL